MDWASLFPSLVLKLEKRRRWTAILSRFYYSNNLKSFFLEISFFMFVNFLRYFGLPSSSETLTTTTEVSIHGLATVASPAPRGCVTRMEGAPSMPPVEDKANIFPPPYVINGGPTQRFLACVSVVASASCSVSQLCATLTRGDAKTDGSTHWGR